MWSLSWTNNHLRRASVHTILLKKQNLNEFNNLYTLWAIKRVDKLSTSSTLNYKSDKNHCRSSECFFLVPQERKKKTKKISKTQASLKTRRKTQKNINSDSATSSSQNHVLNTTFLNVHIIFFFPGIHYTQTQSLCDLFLCFYYYALYGVIFYMFPFRTYVIHHPGHSYLLLIHWIIVCFSLHIMMVRIFFLYSE